MAIAYFEIFVVVEIFIQLFINFCKLRTFAKFLCYNFGLAVSYALREKISQIHINKELKLKYNQLKRKQVCTRKRKLLRNKLDR